MGWDRGARSFFCHHHHGHSHHHHGNFHYLLPCICEDSIYSLSVSLFQIIASGSHISITTRYYPLNRTQPLRSKTTTTQIKSQNPKSCHLGYNQSLIQHTSTILILRCWSRQNLQRLSCVWPNCNYQGWPID